MATSVFKRREKKYLVDAGQREAIEGAARAHMAPDAYGRTLITSVYLDTPDRSIISRSLERPLYKEKLRIRTYGTFNGGALLCLCRDGLETVERVYAGRLAEIPAFLELKKKFKGIVYKRRIRLSLLAAWAFYLGASLEAAREKYPLCPSGGGEGPENLPCMEGTGASKELEAQIARELRAALERHGALEPSMAILCWRTAWAPLDECDEPRITFDDNLRFVDLGKANSGEEPVISSTTSIMEIKATNALPDWLTDVLSSTRTYPQSFSKYGQAARIACAR